MSLLTVEAEVVGYNKKWVWLRIFRGGTFRGLTLPRDFLPWGMATADRVVLEYKDESFHFDGHAFVVEGQITRKLDDGETLDATIGPA